MTSPAGIDTLIGSGSQTLEPLQAIVTPLAEGHAGNEPPQGIEKMDAGVVELSRSSLGNERDDDEIATLNGPAFTSTDTGVAQLVMMRERQTGTAQTWWIRISQVYGDAPHA